MTKANITTCIDQDLLDTLDSARGHRVSRSSFLNMLLAAFFLSGMAVEELAFSRGRQPDRYAFGKDKRRKRGDTE